MTIITKFWNNEPDVKYNTSVDRVHKNNKINPENRIYNYISDSEIYEFKLMKNIL